ncbi:MAG: PIN domain-containing protein [Gemmatimonas sp.]|nr:PIN domain-containing protein [Gemmatimonas sp.]
MKFWDASAVVPLLVDEERRDAMLALLEEDEVMLVWWATPVECTSAIARRERESSLTAEEAAISIDRLRYLKEGWQEVLPSTVLRGIAERLLRVHPLRAADSLQIAAAIVAAEREPVTLELVSLDDRLSDAASREGFRVLRG